MWLPQPVQVALPHVLQVILEHMVIPFGESTESWNYGGAAPEWSA